MGGFGLGFDDRRSLAARFLFVLMCFVRTPPFEEKLMLVRPPRRLITENQTSQIFEPGHQKRVIACPICIL